MAKIGKRKYPAIFHDNGKWYTGYEEYASPEPCPDHLKDNEWLSRYYSWKSSDVHEARVLELQYSGYSRGRSAANIHLVDREGFEYIMSMSGFDLLMKITCSSRERLREQGMISYEKGELFDISIVTDMGGRGKWFRGNFCQTKQGKNYFIEPCEVR